MGLSHVVYLDNDGSAAKSFVSPEALGHKESLTPKGSCCWPFGSQQRSLGV